MTLAALGIAILAFVQAAPAPDGRGFRIDGNRTFGSARLRVELGPWLDDLAQFPDDVGTRDDLADEAVRFYRKHGFPEATAKVRDEVGEGGAVVILAIEEGPRAYLQSLTLIGNRALDDAILEGAFPWPRTSFLPGARSIHTEDALAAGVAGIRLLYALQGYLDATVSTRVDRRRVVATETGDGEEGAYPLEFLVRVVVDVTEGPRTTLESVEIIPGVAVPEETISAFAGVRPGDPITPRFAVEVRGRVHRRLLDLGYYLARVTAELVESSPNRRRLTLRIEEGPVHTFGSVLVSGNERTRSGFIRDRLGIEFGERYSASALEAGQRELNSTGLFERFEIDLVPWEEGDPTRLNISIDVVEQEAIRFDTRVGFSTYELGRLGVGALHRNLFGLGIEGRLGALVSFKGEELEGRLRYPYLFDRDIALELRGKYRRFEEVSFERNERIGSVALEIPVRRRLTLTTGFEMRDEIIEDVDVDIVDIDEIAESSRAHVLFIGERYDARDSILDPTKGEFITSRFEWSDREFGSDLDFVRLTARSSITRSLGADYRGVLALQVGGIERLDPGEVPLGERFFLGGPRSVRSYRLDRMPPIDDQGDPIGGEAFVAGSAEMRRRLFGSFHGALFIDAGSLSTELEEFAGRNWRFGTGLGFIWVSPVGPLRIDWGITLNPQPGEDHWAIHVLIGQPF